MADALHIRPLKASDRAPWRSLWNGYLAFYQTALQTEVTDTTFERMLAPDEPMHGLVAEQDGRLIGFAHYLLHRSTWADWYCYLEDIYADPITRGRGIGRSLIEAVEAAAREAGATRLYWVTQTDNAIARGLYDRVATATNFVQYRKVL